MVDPVDCVTIWLGRERELYFNNYFFFICGAVLLHDGAPAHYGQAFRNFF